MADAALANIKLLEALSGLPALITGQGAKTVTGGGGQTQTEQTMFSPESMQSMLRTILESQQGLAEVAGGQKTPGLYNSTSRTLLTNDFLTRSAARVAEVAAPKVTTSTKAPTTVQVIQPKANTTASQLGLLGALLSSSGAKKLMNRGIDFLTQDSREMSVEEFMGPASEAAFGPLSVLSDYGPAAASDILGGYDLGSGMSEFSSSPENFSDSIGSIYDLVGGGDSLDMGGGIDAASDLVSNFFDDDEAYRDVLEEAAGFFGWD